MNINRYDVIIIGGGYIGLAVAIFLGKIGLKVIIIEKDKITSKKSYVVCVVNNNLYDFSYRISQQ